MDIERTRRPAADALKDWGLAHRFAGSSDRAAIGNLVHDGLRRKRSTAWRMGDEGARALGFGVLLFQWGHTLEELIELFANDRFAPPPLSAEEIAIIDARDIDDAPNAVRADVPDWIVPAFEENFAEDWVDECAALATRAPTDLRINTLKADTAKVLKALPPGLAVNCSIARHGLRIAPPVGSNRQANVQANAGFQKGWFEIQDEGSQIVGELVLAKAGEQVLDFCAGAGGKTLALGAAMENRGQIHAYDQDKNRLAAIHERIRRSGLRNVQVHPPGGDLSALTDRMDRVVVDAPCTGTGVWRRRPDAKWRLRQGSLQQRCRQQVEVLDQACAFVRPGGYLFYITCSLLRQENEAQVEAFITRNPRFELLSAGEAWQDLYSDNKAMPWSGDMKTVTLTPAATATDGFFFAVIERQAGT